MNLGFVYAGQGSQKPGMGQDLYKQYPVFRRVLDSLDPTGEIRNLAFDSPMEVLCQTENTQKTMVAFGIALTELLASLGFRPCVAAGLSLGEYTALYAGGAFDSATAVDLVSYRGRVMAQAAQGCDSKMVAVLKGDIEKIRQACKAASALGIVGVANYNCPEQTVIGGEAPAVDKAVDLIMAGGARRCIPLAVSGPFHTPIMDPAAEAMSKKLATIDFKPLTIPVFFNVTGQKLADGQSIAQLLTEQVKSPVHFTHIIRGLASESIDAVVEIGPGKVLSGFIKKTEPSIKTYSVEDSGSLEKFLETMKEMENE